MSYDKEGKQVMAKLLKYIVVGSACFIILTGVKSAEAALIYLDPAEGVRSLGDTFIVAVRVDNQGQCLNAFDVKLKFSKNVIKAVDFMRGDSILTLWIQDPTIDQEAGTVSFIGGLPGGYCGRVSGDPGVTNVLGKIVFQVPGFRIGNTAENVGTVEFMDGTKALLSDGNGTPAELKTGNARFEIGPGGQNALNEWLDIVKKDNTVPEPFSVQLLNDKDIFGGKYFVAFSTIDRQSGLDHFEVLESDDLGFVYGTTKLAQWQQATSPYPLRDQDLKSVIKVKAVDKAGNERVVQLTLPNFEPREVVEARKRQAIEIGAGLLILVFVGIYLFRRHKYGKPVKKS
jgi:hypothetical protein